MKILSYLTMKPVAGQSVLILQREYEVEQTFEFVRCGPGPVDEVLPGVSRRVQTKVANTKVSLFETNHARESACMKMKNEDESPMTNVGDDGGQMDPR